MEILKRLQKSKRKQTEVNPLIRDYLEANPAVKFLHGDKIKKPEWVIGRMLPKLEDCGSFLHLREWLQQDGEVTLKKANFCKQHLLCNVCAIRRAAKTCAAYKPKIEKVLADNPHLMPVSITLTVKNGEDLEKTFAVLYDAWRDMTKHASNAKRQSRGYHHYDKIEWNKVQGFVRSAEVTNKGKGWHPHYHVLALIDDYIDHERFKNEWLEFTGGSFIVGVTKIQPDEEGIMHALLETLKYAVKFGDLKPEQIAQVWARMRGSRFVSPGGLLRGVPPIDDLTDEDLTGPYQDYYAFWLHRCLAYKLEPVENECVNHEMVSKYDLSDFGKNPEAAIK